MSKTAIHPHSKPHEQPAAYPIHRGFPKLYILAGLLYPQGKKLLPYVGLFRLRQSDHALQGRAIDFLLNRDTVSTFAGRMTDFTLDFLMSCSSPEQGTVDVVEYTFHNPRLIHPDVALREWEGRYSHKEEEGKVTCRTLLSAENAFPVDF